MKSLCRFPFFPSLSLCLTHAVHQWNQSYFMPSPPSTTCCCTKRGPRWLCASPMACRGWFPYWKRAIPSFWPSLPTVCSSCPMATRRVRWGKNLNNGKETLVVSSYLLHNHTSYFLLLSAHHPSQWRPRRSGVHHEELQLWKAPVDHQPRSQSAVCLSQQQTSNCRGWYVHITEHECKIDDCIVFNCILTSVSRWYASFGPTPYRLKSASDPELSVDTPQPVRCCN